MEPGRENPDESVESVEIAIPRVVLERVKRVWEAARDDSDLLGGGLPMGQVRTLGRLREVLGVLRCPVWLSQIDARWPTVEYSDDTRIGWVV
jgi:hypothetical protein